MCTRAYSVVHDALLLSAHLREHALALLSLRLLRFLPRDLLALLLALVTCQGTVLCLVARFLQQGSGRGGVPVRVLCGTADDTQVPVTQRTRAAFSFWCSSLALRVSTMICLASSRRRCAWRSSSSSAAWIAAFCTPDRQRGASQAGTPGVLHAHAPFAVLPTLGALPQ